MVRVLTIFLAAATVLTATGCADMTARQRNTAIGAGVGGLAGAALIGGPGATLGGAALGGLVGIVQAKADPGDNRGSVFLCLRAAE